MMVYGVVPEGSGWGVTRDATFLERFTRKVDALAFARWEAKQEHELCGIPIRLVVLDASGAPVAEWDYPTEDEADRGDLALDAFTAGGDPSD